MQERVDLFGGRGNPREVERRASQERPPVGRRRRPEPGGFEPRQDEPVHRGMGPPGIEDPWRGGVDRHPERPEPSRRFGPSRDRAAVGLGGSREAGRGRPRGSHLDPRGQRLDLGRREFLLRRHRDVALVAHRENQQAPLRLAANDRRAGEAALQESLERVDAQLRLAGARVGAVASIAVLGQGRPNTLLEEREGRPGSGRILDVRGRRGRIRAAARHGRRRVRMRLAGRSPRIMPPIRSAIIRAGNGPIRPIAAGAESSTRLG